MGRVFKPQYKATLPDGTAEIRVMKHWYIEYWDASGRQRRKKASLTKGQADEILRKVESDVSNQKNGLPTQNLGEIRLEDLKQKYLASIQGRVVAQHWAGTKARIEAVLTGTGAVFLRDLTADRLEGYLAAMADRNPVPAARTVNSHLQGIKTMLCWAVRSRLIPYSPLAAVMPRSEREKRIKRRPLTEWEIERILQVAPTSPLVRARTLRKHQPSPERVQVLLKEGEGTALIWRVFIFTGLRVGELRALRWDDLDLDQRTLHVRAETTKSGKSAVLPLAGHLVEALRHWQAKTQGRPGQVVVAVPRDMARRLRLDLKLAGIPYKDEAGRQADAHALRHTFGTMLSRRTDPKTLQASMRHANPQTTLGIYVHASQSRMREAVDALAIPSEVQVPLRTGTAG